MNNFLKTVNEAIKHWYLPLIVGVLFVVTGVYTLFSPAEAYLTLSVLFSLSFLFSGLLEITFAILNRNSFDNWGWSLIFGIVTAVFGVILIVNPQVSIATLPFYIGVVILFRSIMGMSFALDLKNYGVIEWGSLMVLSLLGMIFAFILISNPALAGLTVVSWTGVALIFGGVNNISVSLKLKKMKETSAEISEELKEKYNQIQQEIKSELEKGRSK